MVQRTGTRRWTRAILAGALVVASARAQDCMESFELPDDPERVVITDIGIELEDLFAVHGDDEEIPEGIDAPAIAFAWRAYDRSARARPRPSKGRLRVFYTPPPEPEASPDSEPEAQSDCEEFEIEFAAGVRHGMQTFPPPSSPEADNVPPPGEYRVQIEVAHQDEQGLVRERNLGNNIASIDLNYYSEVAVTEAEATGSGLRLKLVNGGTRQTEELTVRVFSGGQPVEETVEGIPGLPFFDQPPEDFAENEREVQVSLTNVGERITYVIEEVPTGRQVGGGNTAVDGGGGSTPGGGGGGGSTPGGGGGGGTAPPPSPPRTSQGPDYEVESIHVLPGDARDGIYTVVANIRNNGSPTTDRARIEVALEGARSRQSQSSQGNARITDPMEDVGPIPPRSARPVMAILDLSEESDPARRADEVDLRVTVQLSGDTESENDSRSETHRVSGAIDQAARPPDWERGEPWHYYHRPEFAFGPGYYVWRGDVRNQGGPAMSVEGEITVDADDWERFFARGLELRATTGQGGTARALSAWYVKPAYYPPPGSDTPRFQATLPVNSTYRGGDGQEEAAEAQEVTWEDIPFFYEYPSLDLAAKLTEPGGDDAVEGTLTLNVDEPRELELVITNNSELRILAGTSYEAEVTQEPSAGVQGGPGETGEFEDLEPSGSYRVPDKFEFQAGCPEYTGGGGGAGGLTGLAGGAGGSGGTLGALGGLTGGSAGGAGGMGGGAVSLGTLEIKVGFDRDSLQDIPDHIDDHDESNSTITLQIELADPSGQCQEEEGGGLAGLASGNPLSAVDAGLGIVNTGLEAAGVEDTGIGVLDTALDEGTGGLIQEGLEAAGVDEGTAGLIGDAASGNTQGVIDGVADQAGVDIPTGIPTSVPTGIPTNVPTSVPPGP